MSCDRPLLQRVRGYSRRVCGPLNAVSRRHVLRRGQTHLEQCLAACFPWLSTPITLDSRLTKRRGSIARHTTHTGCNPTAAATEAAAPVAEDKWNTTYYPNGQDTANERKPWYIIDAEGQTLGRLATLAATHIRHVYTTVSSGFTPRHTTLHNQQGQALADVQPIDGHGRLRRRDQRRQGDGHWA